MGSEKKPGFAALASQPGYETLEKTIDLKKKRHRLYIGIPREDTFQENRIPLTPDSVAVLVNSGHRIVIETRAGENAHYKDEEYLAAGGEVVYDKRKVFEADVILKVAPLSDEEISMLHDLQTLMTPIHLPTLKREYIEALMSKRITALAFEYIKDDSNTFPFVRTLSEIAGSSAILIASELLSDQTHGKGILLGGISGIPPVKVLILGAGVVGEYATRTALGLGAIVKIFDNNIYKLLRLQNNIGTRIYTSIINPNILTEELQTTDVAVGAIHSESGRTPILVTEEMVMNMKPGSVIIDVSIDQGGCFETSELTSHSNPTFKKHDVIHYCVPNIASRVSRTASFAVSNIVTTTLQDVSEFGGFENHFRRSAGARHGVYIYKGYLTNHYLSERFYLRYTSLELLITSNM